MPVYESTPGLGKVRVEQMHVLFSFASDGMDVKQLYALSNLGDRTVKDGVKTPGKSGAKAVVQFPLPEKADFINFQPQDEARFVKFPGSFADTAPLVPAQMSSQFIVDYLLPYAEPLTFQRTTVLPVQTVNFVEPEDSGVKLKGLGLGLFGVALFGGSAFWCVRSSRGAEAVEAEVMGEEDLGQESEFESLLAEITQLDQCLNRASWMKRPTASSVHCSCLKPRRQCLRRKFSQR